MANYFLNTAEEYEYKKTASPMTRRKSCSFYEKLYALPAAIHRIPELSVQLTNDIKRLSQGPSRIERSCRDLTPVRQNQGHTDHSSTIFAHDRRLADLDVRMYMRKGCRSRFDFVSHGLSSEADSISITEIRQACYHTPI